MTIKEIRDLFYTKYSLECQLRKIDKIQITDKMLSFFISSAQQDIQRRLQVVESTVEIELGSSSSNYISSNTYSLPSNFGKQKHAYIGSNLLQEKSLVWLEQYIASGGSGYYYAIKPAGHTSYIICPVSSGTITLNYYPDLAYYQPTVSASQSWGNFDGVTYSGDLILPDRYNMAILYNMLFQIFPEYLELYEKELKSLRESRLFSSDNRLNYNLGWAEDEPSDRETTTTTTMATVSISALDQPVKRLRIKANDTGSYTIEYSAGWTTMPTVLNSIGAIVITSPDSEFTNYVEVGINNDNFGKSQSGADTITIYPDPTSGWGEVEIILNIYD